MRIVKKKASAVVVSDVLRLLVSERGHDADADIARSSKCL